MEKTKHDDQMIPRRVSGTVLAVLTSKLVVDMLADQPRSVRLAAAVAWAVAFVFVWEIAMKAFVAARRSGKDLSP